MTYKTPVYEYLFMIYFSSFQEKNYKVEIMDDNNFSRFRLIKNLQHQIRKVIQRERES